MDRRSVIVNAAPLNVTRRGLKDKGGCDSLEAGTSDPQEIRAALKGHPLPATAHFNV